MTHRHDLVAALAAVAACSGSLALLLLALMLARSAAMAFNRLADAKYDQTNPRTQNRPLAAGVAGKGAYALFVLAAALAFVGVCQFINPLAFYLSPLALAVVLFYSFTKRFTAFSHLFLGIALALAPIGAWIAVRGEVDLAPLILGGAVVFWLVGLDIIYSCQDVEHDKNAGLFSIPSRYGVARALSLSAMAHVVMVALLASLFFISDLGLVYLAGVILTAGLLWYEHGLVRPDDLRKVNVAFFNVAFKHVPQKPN